MICGLNNPMAIVTEYVIEEILDNLPASIQSLELQNVNCELQVAQPETIFAVTRFLNLTQLQIIESKGLLNDAFLQAICRNLAKLRALGFENGQITDFGLTGEMDNYNYGLSLRNLKGLHYLKILNCCQQTEEGIVKSIQFAGLRNLWLNRFISDATLVTIAKNNPSLEFVYRHRCFKEGVPLSLVKYHRELFSSILAVNPRLTRIHTERFHYTHRTGDAIVDLLPIIPSRGVSSTFYY